MPAALKLNYFAFLYLIGAGVMQFTGVFWGSEEKRGSGGDENGLV